MECIKVLLISEAPMCENAGGISQTLVNIFGFLEADQVLFVCPKNEILDYPPIEKFKERYVGYRYDFVTLPPNRFTEKVGNLIAWINNGINFWRPFRKLKKRIAEFNPDVIISCPNGIRGVIVHENLLKNELRPVIPYFMDDWMYQSDHYWLGGNIQAVIQKILKKNKSWLVISGELTSVLCDRYAAEPTRLLVVHNPVDITDAVIPKKSATNKKVLAYAGALWDMHIDALILVVKAVEILQKKMPIEIVIYTPKKFWDWRKKLLEMHGAVYGGNLPYKEVHRYLSEADALIVVSSFREELYTHALASLQTKVTDYLKSRRPVISVGPTYAANHSFLKRHQCGVCIETDQLEIVAEQLENILMNVEQHEVLVANGWNLLEKELSKPIVQDKVAKFLQACIINN